MLKELIIKTLRPYPFRGKARLLETLSECAGEIETDVFGYQTKLDISDFIQRRIYVGAYEQRETQLVRDYLKPGMTFVDVGANVGYFSLLAASIVRSSGRVLSFEPSPYASQRLRETVVKNRIDQITVFPVGIAERSGELSLFLPKASGNHTPTMIPNEGGEPFKVSVCRLDQCLRGAGVERVDFLKIDVEGFEPDVLKSVDTYLREKRIDAILCEFSQYWLERNGSGGTDLYEILESFGFRSSGGSDDRLKKGAETLLFRRVV